MTNATQYDELYVISDLHMGGKPGFQIMNRGKRLASFIEQLAVRPPVESGRRVGLVINGDVIDTLAEEFEGYIAVADAERVLTRLYDDEAFAPVWSALATFVRQARRRLIFTIGNHDIELALPAVQHSIRRRLAGDDEAAFGRIEFAVEGAGYTCSVGDVRIFCTHGNEVDGWNVVDHDALRRLVRDQNAGVPFNAAAWTPNAGTRLVRDVMNQVKRQRPWLDLLKPEKNVVLGVLLTIDPSVARHVPALVPVAWRRGIGELQRQGLLSATESTSPPGTVTADPLALSDAVGPHLQRLIDGMEQSHATAPHAVAATGVDPMMLDIERQLASGIPARGQSAIWKARSVGPGCCSTVCGWSTESMRYGGLSSIGTPTTTALIWRIKDETCRRILAHVGSDVDVVVTGHTHLERAILTARRAYYNTGTWIRSIRLPDVLLRELSTFSQLYRLLDQATLAELDNATVRGVDGRAMPLVADVTTALQITARADAVVACLGHVVDDARAGARFDGIAGSEFRGV